jgi:hypothetical protein
LDGLVDTQVRGSWTAAPWMVLTLGVNVPTGNSGHDSEEAVVAGALATELFGFREASWGTGLAVTSGLAMAHRAGDWGIGIGGSYRVASEFEPRAETDLKYQPGNELRARLALDRSFGQSSKFTGGLTFQSFSDDQLDGRDLFASGNRYRGDVALSFRSGPSTSWPLYVADIWREEGDLTLQVLSSGGAVTGDSILTVGSQNLLIAGISGSLRASGSVTIRPTVDVRVQSQARSVAGDGWLVGGGGDVPIRAGSLDLFPGARVFVGSLSGPTGESGSVFGGEASLTVRWGGR